MTDSQHWGATPGEWDHFDLVLGLGPDLLPVVSNPGATISPQSKMKALGKTPSVYNRSRNAAGFPEWASHQASAADIERWRAEPDYGICLQTRTVRAIDIDIPDQEQADEILRAVLAFMSGCVRYREGTGKCLLAFRMPGEFSKRSFKTSKGLVEFLANGQQFIAVGTHPDGSRYQWDGEIEFPDVALEQFERAWAGIVEGFATEAPRDEQSSKTKTQALAQAHASDPVVAALVERGLVLSHERDGRLHITCPFEDEHTTDSAESATSYFPAHTGGFARGHFHCLHAHCAERGDLDFLQALHLAPDPRDDFVAVDDIHAAVEVAREATSSKTFEFQTVVQFKDGKPVSWFVKGVLPKAELIVVYGPPGSGKSFWTTDVALAISRGLEEWCGKRVKRARVGYVAAEGAPGFRNRLEAYCAEHQIPLEELPLFVLPAAPNLMQRDDVIALGNAILSVGKLDLLIVDTLARTTTGADENSAKDMGVVIDHCRVLHEVTGATVLLVHHSGKDASKGARGSNAILGAADTEIEISRDGERRMALVSKMKDGEDGAMFGFRLKPVTIGMDEDGDTITSCVVEQTDTPVIVKRERKLGVNEQRVWQALLDLQNLGQTAPGVEVVIAQAAEQMVYDSESGKRDNRRRDAQRALERLRESGKITIERGAVLIPGDAQ